MTQFIPAKLHVQVVQVEDGVTATAPLIPRCYTLTHSDFSGELFLTIGKVYDHSQISGWYTRLMRDEVLASWQNEKEPSFARSLPCQWRFGGGFSPLA